MGIHKERDIILNDLNGYVTQIKELLGAIQIEIEFSSHSNSKAEIKEVIKDFNWLSAWMIQITREFYRQVSYAKHISTDHECDTGGAEEWGGWESTLEEAVDRVLDSEKRSNKKTI